jgi:hypothetical protein
VVEVSEERLRKIMATAEETGAYYVAVMLAQVLKDEKSADRLAGKQANVIAYDIPLSERTPARIHQVKLRILSETG